MTGGTYTFTYLAPVWLTTFMVVAVCAYSYAGWCVSERLRATQPELWRQMGEPFARRSASSMWNLGRYTLLSAEHRDTQDEHLTRLVYLVRVLFAIALSAVILCAAIGHQVTIRG